MIAVGVYAIWSTLLWILAFVLGGKLQKPAVEIVQVWVGANILTGIPYWLVAFALMAFGIVR